MKTKLRTILLSLILPCAALAGQQQPKYKVSLFYKQTVSYSYSGYDPLPIEGPGFIIARGMNNHDEVIAGYGTTPVSPPYGPITITNGVAHVYRDPGFTENGHSAGFLGINDSGEIVGWVLGYPQYQSFIYRPNGPGAGFNLLTAMISEATVINNSGAVAGQENSSQFPGFIYKNGLITGILGPVVGINDNNDAVGFYYNLGPVSQVTHSFVYSKGRYTDLGVPHDATGVYAYRINDSGDIVGSIGFPYVEDFRGIKVPITIYHPFLYNNGKLKDLGNPAGSPNANNGDGPAVASGYALGINDSGTILGTSGIPWIYVDGEFHFLKDLIPAGYTIYDAVAINDRGQILIDGQKTSPTYSDDMYLLTPTEEKVCNP